MPAPPAGEPGRARTARRRKKRSSAAWKKGRIVLTSMQARLVSLTTDSAPASSRSPACTLLRRTRASSSSRSRTCAARRALAGALRGTGLPGSGHAVLCPQATRLSSRLRARGAAGAHAANPALARAAPAPAAARCAPPGGRRAGAAAKLSGPEQPPHMLGRLCAGRPRPPARGSLDSTTQPPRSPCPHSRGRAAAPAADPRRTSPWRA